MHSVLLVDDDILVRLGLRMLIDWPQAGWEIVGEAAGGMQALDMIETMNPDLLIMDMKMPQMDGAELLQRLRQDHRRLKVIVLSCYDDYSYMREALATGADAYILKPELTAETLGEALDRIGARMEEEEKRVKEFYELKQQAALHHHYARDTFFRELLRGTYAGRSELESAAAHHGVDLLDSEYAVLLFAIVRPEQSFEAYDPAKREAVEHSLYSMLQGLLQALPVSCLIRDTHAWDYIAVVGRPAGGALLQEAEAVAGRAVQAVAAYMQLKLTVGISGAARSPAELGAELGRAREALRRRLLLEDRSVFAGEEPAADEDRLRESVRMLQGRVAELCAVLVRGEGERGAELLDRLLKDTQQSGSMRLLQALCSELAGWYNRQLDSELYEGRHVREATYMNVEDMLNARDAGELAAQFLERVDRLRDTGLEPVSPDVSPAIRRALAYIQGHYDRPIGLAELAAHVGMSRSHLSYVFREQTGLTFIDYLSAYRIEMAKRLLRSDAGKIYEIATKVGFDNEKYFSQVFRSRVGVTPTEYKRSMT